jgi:hypothetical protein
MQYSHPANTQGLHSELFRMEVMLQPVRSLMQTRYSQPECVKSCRSKTKDRHQGNAATERSYDRSKTSVQRRTGLE